MSISTIPTGFIYCPSCRNTAKLVSENEYDEFYCKCCDHIWFEKKDNISLLEAYENSEKYLDYYIGNPPFLWYHKIALEYIKNNAADSRILDFGCYDGFFVRRLLDANLNAFGCDWNSKAIEHGAHEFELGDRLSRDPLGVYDVIVALEVIEHFEHPDEFMGIVLRHLSNSGILILSCPNKNSIYRPKTDAPPHHFSRFSKKSLRSLMERHGLDVVHHFHEMSTFQLLRNVIGDSIRNTPPLLGEKRTESSSKPATRWMKRIANHISGTAESASWPLDTSLHKLGFAYLSQLIIVRTPNAS